MYPPPYIKPVVESPARQTIQVGWPWLVFDVDLVRVSGCTTATAYIVYLLIGLDPETDRVKPASTMDIYRDRTPAGHQAVAVEFCRLLTQRDPAVLGKVKRALNRYYAQH